MAIAEPLAFLPELNVLVQGPIHEEWTLEEFFRFALEAGTPEALEQLRGYLRKTGRGLAELHQCGLRCGEPITWEDERAEIRARNAKLAASLPQCAEAITALLAHLERVAAWYPADPAGPVHRSFRPAQVLLYKNEIGFIDFDGFCQAEPALDLALFLTEIEELGLGQVKTGQKEGGEEAPDPDDRVGRLARLEDLYRVFLDEYNSVSVIIRLTTSHRAVGSAGLGHAAPGQLDEPPSHRPRHSLSGRGPMSDARPHPAIGYAYAPRVA